MQPTQILGRLKASMAPLVSLVAVVCVVALAATAMTSGQHETGPLIPPPAIDQRPSQASTEVAVFAGGCFWGVQGVFQHVKGVTAAVSGYAGGERRTAHYEIVGEGGSGHAESVRVTFDPRQVSYGRLLQVFFSVVHDPTQLNGQGPDVGTQYRSAIFPTGPEQEKVARAYIAQLDHAGVYKEAIVTTIEPGRPFYEAEGYHQDYLTMNPRQPYIVINDLPKIAALKHAFPDLYRAAPVLVGTR